jgi:hypothetical protein
MLQKISLPVLVTIMCILLGGVITLAYLNKGYLSQIFNKTKDSQKTEEIKITRTDYSQVARKTLDWIDKQRGDDGWYILERGCDFKTKTCDVVWNNEEGNKDGLIATWARFNFYNQTKDPKDLEIVKSDINKFYEKYPNGVDNALWICKITYDMWQSNLFDQTTKDKLEKICFNSQFPTPEEVKKYWDGGKTEEVKKIGDKTNTWEKWGEYVISLRGFDSNVAYSTDFLYRYRWHKDKNDLELAKKYFDVTSGAYKDETFGLENTCLLGLSALDMTEFNVSTNSNLDYAIGLFNIIGSNENQRKYVNSICGFFAKSLWLKKNENLFIKNLEFNNQILTTFNLDGASNKIASDNGFWSAAFGSISRLKSVVDNALVVESLRN